MKSTNFSTQIKKTIFFIFICFCHKTYSQDIMQFKLDSLKRVKKEYENKITDINYLINEIENKKAIAENGLKSIDYLVPANTVIKIREEDNPNGTVIYQPHEGETLKLIDFKNSSEYWLVSYNNSTGYVNDMYIQYSPQITEFKKNLIATRVKKAEENIKLDIQKDKEKQILEAQQRESSIIKKYSNETAKKIQAGKIWLGMTDEMALYSWGKPNSINRTVGSWGVHEQWVYGSSTYLYFENGKLTSWQN